MARTVCYLAGAGVLVALAVFLSTPVRLAGRIVGVRGVGGDGRLSGRSSRGLRMSRKW
jgi:hypothetical protein